MAGVQVDERLLDILASEAVDPRHFDSDVFVILLLPLGGDVDSLA